MGRAPPDALPPPTLAELQEELDARGPAPLRAHDPMWLSRFRINERKVKDYGAGRVFLAGDAAHIHSPAGGQGMNTGMQDAFNLAWKLALVAGGHAKRSLLDSYSIERSAIGEQVLRNAGRLTQIGITRNPVLQAVRNFAMETIGKLDVVQAHVLATLAEIDLHYPDSPLTRDGDGRRAPDVACDGGRLHELLRAGRFVVLSVGVPRVELPAEMAPLAMSAIATPNADYRAGHVYLVRPDAYVASTDASRTLDALAALRA
jgi:hypothetical protein